MSILIPWWLIALVCLILALISIPLWFATEYYISSNRSDLSATFRGRLIYGSFAAVGVGGFAYSLWQMFS